MKKEITKETILKEIIEDPELSKILKKHNFPCVSCPMAKIEMDRLKLGEVCDMYNINKEELIKDLNNL